MLRINVLVQREMTCCARESSSHVFWVPVHSKELTWSKKEKKYANGKNHRFAVIVARGRRSFGEGKVENVKNKKFWKIPLYG